VTKGVKVEDTLDYVRNKMYAPDLFEVIEEKLHLCPLWSAILFKNLKAQFNLIHLNTRVTNNYVENSFGFLKRQILQRRIVYPSEFTQKRYVSKLSINIYSYYLDFNF
jgi:hypothetical protein